MGLFVGQHERVTRGVAMGEDLGDSPWFVSDVPLGFAFAIGLVRP